MGGISNYGLRENVSNQMPEYTALSMWDLGDKKQLNIVDKSMNKCGRIISQNVSEI